MRFSYSFGYNDRFGIELRLFSYDPIDYEFHMRSLFSIKILVKALGLSIYLLGAEVAKDYSGITIFNCGLAIFY